jgi:hypothetical protein
VSTPDPDGFAADSPQWSQGESGVTVLEAATEGPKLLDANRLTSANGAERLGDLGIWQPVSRRVTYSKSERHGHRLRPQGPGTRGWTKTPGNPKSQRVVWLCFNP